jgi:hypothetical protein
VSVYAQCLANLATALIRPAEAETSALLSQILMTGILIATIFSITQNNITPSEILTAILFAGIDITLLYPIVVISYLQSVKPDQTPTRLSWWTVLISLLRLAGFAGLSIWFWFVGLTIPNPAQCMEPRVFFFANVGAYGGIKYVLKVATVIAALGVAAVLFPLLYSFAEHQNAYSQNPKVSFQKRWEVHWPDWGLKFEPVRWRQSPHLLQLPKFPDWSKITSYMLIGVGIFAYTILGLELQIVWNHWDGINTVSSVGQLIPLSVATFAVLRAFGLLLFEGPPEINNGPNLI